MGKPDCKDMRHQIAPAIVTTCELAFQIVSFRTSVKDCNRIRCIIACYYFSTQITDWTESSLEIMSNLSGGPGRLFTLLLIFERRRRTFSALVRNATGYVTLHQRRANFHFARAQSFCSTNFPATRMEFERKLTTRNLTVFHICDWRQGVGSQANLRSGGK